MKYSMDLKVNLSLCTIPCNCGELSLNGCHEMDTQLVSNLLKYHELAQHHIGCRKLNLEVFPPLKPPPSNLILASPELIVNCCNFLLLTNLGTQCRKHSS